jgi:predicted DsbA family dithiol-disulfide isomerase
MSDTADSVIEVFADIWCPFTHVGLRAFDEQRFITGRTDLMIRVRPWPLELVNGTPLDPAATKAHVDDLRVQVAPMLFQNLDLDHFPRSTLASLALVERAYRTGLRIGERASFILRNALFEEGRDISDPVVLRSIAEELGIEMPDAADHAAVLSGWRDGQRRGVLGSPHFFCGDRDVFCPSLEITKGPEHDVAILRDTSRLTEFLEQCFSAPTDG